MTHPRVESAPPPWWTDNQQLADLWRWLAEEGLAPLDPAHYMEKPWHYDDEHQRMCRETDLAGAA